MPRAFQPGSPSLALAGHFGGPENKSNELAGMTLGHGGRGINFQGFIYGGGTGLEAERI